MINTLTGLVLSSSIKKPTHPSLLTTKIQVRLDEGQVIPYATVDSSKPVELSVRGRHVLGGQRIRAGYQYHTGVLWVESYELLNARGEAIHSDSSFDF
ncbi:MAG: hypothetical protein KKB21_00730 [Nanoarchaeota archaeon]|nr:hypothetical protein [Nanoarchaeota archaeon]